MMFGETSPQPHPTCHNLSYTHRKISFFKQKLQHSDYMNIHCGSYVSVDTVTIFCMVVFTRERCETKEVLRRDVEALWKSLCLAACAKQWRQPSLLAMTLMRGAHGQSGHAHGPHTWCDPLCLFVASLAYRHVLRQGRGLT